MVVAKSEEQLNGMAKACGYERKPAVDILPALKDEDS